MINYAILALVAGVLPFILAYPFMGVVAWHWIGIMNPHRLAWGFASDLPVAMMVGAVTLLALVLSREPKRLPLHPIPILLVVFCLWMTMTTVVSVAPDAAWGMWDQTIKVLLMALVAMVLMTTRERIHALVWVIVIALGFFAVKGGVFTILNGGQYRVWGPPNSFIFDNNQLALALMMTLPLIRYLQIHTEQRLLRFGLGVLLVLTVLSIVGSHSRGAFLALMVMGVAFALGSRHRVKMALTGVVLALAVFSFAPVNWFERMETIETYEEDESAMTRLNVWDGTIDMAFDRPIFGAGFLHYYNSANFSNYVEDRYATRSAHSIYIQVLGEHSFVGLALFLLIGLFAVLRCGRIMRLAKGDPERLWAYDLAQMLRLSLLGYAVSGIFLNLAYFDLYYSILGFVVATEGVLSGRVGSEKASRARYRRASLQEPQDDSNMPKPVAVTSRNSTQLNSTEG